jgi:hypothetical protein
MRDESFAPTRRSVVTSGPPSAKRRRSSAARHFAILRSGRTSGARLRIGITDIREAAARRCRRPSVSGRALWVGVDRCLEQESLSAGQRCRRRPRTPHSAPPPHPSADRCSTRGARRRESAAVSIDPHPAEGRSGARGSLSRTPGWTVTHRDSRNALRGKMGAVRRPERRQR